MNGKIINFPQEEIDVAIEKIKEEKYKNLFILGTNEKSSEGQLIYWDINDPVAAIGNLFVALLLISLEAIEFIKEES